MHHSRANDNRQGSKRTAANEAPSYEPLLLFQQQLSSYRQHNPGAQQPHTVSSHGHNTSTSSYASWTNTQQYVPPNYRDSPHGLSRGNSHSTSQYGNAPTHHKSLNEGNPPSLLSLYRKLNSNHHDSNVAERTNRNSSPSGYRDRKDKEHNSSYGSQGSDSENDSLNDSKRRCGNAYYNSGPSGKTHLGSPNDEKLSRTASTSKLSQETIVNFLTQTLHFLEDRNQDVLLFSRANLEEGQFLYNLKNSKRLVKKLTSESSPLYMQVLQEVALNRNVFMWKISWRKIGGRKVPEYRKKYLTEKQLSDRAVFDREGTKITPSFLFKYLKKTLDFLEDSSQSSLIFSEVTDDRRLNFLHNLNSMKTSRFKQQMDPLCLDLYLKIQRIKDHKRHEFTWQALWSKQGSKQGTQKILVYRKAPPGDCADSEGLKKRRRDRTRSRNRNNKDMMWEPTDGDQRSKDPADSIAFLPQRGRDDDARDEAAGDGSAWNPAAAPDQRGRRVNRDKAKILEGLAKPVVATKAERMMQLMGWAGGALGSKGDGIVEPLAPNILQETRAGLGHVRDSPKSTPRMTRRQRGNWNKMDDFEIGVWEPVKPAKKEKKTQQPAKPKRIGVIQRNLINFKTEVLQKILEFVNDDAKLELSFPVDLSSKYRKVVHFIVNCIEEGKDMDYDTTHHMELIKDIEKAKDCVLYTESSGDEKIGERQLILYKTASDSTYIITPDDLEPDIVQPSEFIGEVNQDIIIIDDDDSKDAGQSVGNHGTAVDNVPTDTAKLLKGLTVKAAEHDSKTDNNDEEKRNDFHDKIVREDPTGADKEKDVHSANHTQRGNSGDKSCNISENRIRTNNEDDIDSAKELNAALHNEESTDSHSSETQFVSNAEKSGVNMFGRAQMEGKCIDKCPENSQCWKYMLCRKFLPKEQRSEFRKWFAMANYFAEDESDSENESNTKVTERRRKRTARSVAEAIELNLIENKMKTIEIPKQVADKELSGLNQLTKQERIIKLLVKYFWEFFEDEDCTKLKFLGSFKMADKAIINTFMNELRALPDSLDRLRANFERDEESFSTLKKMFQDPLQKIVIDRNALDTNTSFVVFKVKT